MKPTNSSTAIQLEATAGGEWRLSRWAMMMMMTLMIMMMMMIMMIIMMMSRWAMRMKADISFPVTGVGRVGVPSPGLYLVYAQVTCRLKCPKITLCFVWWVSKGLFLGHRVFSSNS